MTAGVAAEWWAGPGSGDPGADQSEQPPVFTGNKLDSAWKQSLVPDADDVLS